MTALDLLAMLERAGVVLSAKGDRLAYDAPVGVMTADLLATVKVHKAELLALLAKRAELERRIAEQLARLVPYRTAGGGRGWVHPRYRAELDRLGLL